MVRQRQIQRSRGRGVPVGYPEKWNYSPFTVVERKVGPGHWKGHTYGVKSRPAKAMGPKPGSKLEWLRIERQKARKVGKGKYAISSTFTKRLVSAEVKK